jgi:hypothetical protein
MLLAVTTLASISCTRKANEENESKPNNSADHQSENTQVNEPCLVYEPSDLPKIYDCTAQSEASLQKREAIIALVTRARDGLGFPSREGPRFGDYVFINKYYLAWIDNTGYYGKLNGLWTLNGANKTSNLDFTLVERSLDETLRPISLLLPGEDGEGEWPETYNGAEHYEMPRYNQNGDHSAQAGLREANHFGPTAPNTWTECINSNSQPSRWDEPMGESQVTMDGNRIVFSNRAPLKIVAKFNDTYDCGAQFPFNNGEPGEMEIYTDYVMSSDNAKIVRNYQLTNESRHDYVSQTGVDKLIGGLILTDWPRPHYLKQYHKWKAWDDGTLAPSNIAYDGSDYSADHIEVRASGNLVLSTDQYLRAGNNIAITQDDGFGDVGICLCRVHGGFELGGSVLAGLNLPGGRKAESPIHSRTISLMGYENADHTSANNEAQFLGIKAGEFSNEQFDLGIQQGNQLIAEPRSDGNDSGFLYYKNYISMPENSVGQVAFYMAIAPTSPGQPNDKIVTIDLLHNQQIIARKELRRKDFFSKDGQLQRFTLDFATSAPGNIEPRIEWHNQAVTKVGGVALNWK